MPTYDYRCKDCGHEFEIHQSFSEDALTVCPNCQGALRKVFSAVGISFKGSGFYKTDSRGGSAKSSSTPATTGTGESATKSDSAPASTPGSPSSPSDSSSSSSSSSSTSTASPASTSSTPST